MNTKEDLHKNHRSRLLALVEKNGMENISDYNALEFILTYIIPRKDTNPLAHKLLNKFGCFSSVLDAPVEELIRIGGIGERTAKMLTLLPKVFEKYKQDKLENSFTLKTAFDFKKYCLELFNGKEKEEFYMFFLNKNYKLISKRKLSEGELDTVIIKKSEFAKAIVNIPNVYAVAMAHNHPNATCNPSTKDIASTEELTKLLTALGYKFLDHYIVGDDGIYTCLENRIWSKNI